MFLKKNSKTLMSCLILLGLISCKKEGKAVDTIGVNTTKKTNTELKKKEWFSYIDSVYTYPFKNKLNIDSVCLYYMKVNTPSVISKPKYIFWGDAKSVKNGEFNLFIQPSDSQFLVVSNGKRNVTFSEIKINSNKISESKKVLLDLNNDDLLKDPCNQISNIEQKVTSQGILFKIEIFQSCYDKYFYEQLNYPCSSAIASRR